MEFNDLYWHDAGIKGIHIDRSSPGIRDTITFEIQWSEEGGKVHVIFEDVYLANLDLNFGIVADETILNAFELEDHPDMKKIYNKFKISMNDIKLKLYKFELNSSGSKINIIAKRFRLEKL